MVKISAALALVAATLVSAQSAADLPSCSIQCFIQYVPQTGCSLTDYACQCTEAHQNQIKGEITSCVQSKCTAQSDQLKTLQVTNAICAKYGSSSSGSASASSSGSMMSGATSMMSSGAGASSMMATATTSSSSSAAFKATGPPNPTFTGAKAALDLDAKEAIRKYGVFVAAVGGLLGWAL